MIINWTKEKPEITENCLLISARAYEGEWVYETWVIKWAEGDWKVNTGEHLHGHFTYKPGIEPDMYCIIPLCPLLPNSVQREPMDLAICGIQTIDQLREGIESFKRMISYNEKRIQLLINKEANQ